MADQEERTYTVEERRRWLTAVLQPNDPDLIPRYPLVLDGIDISDVLDGAPTLEVVLNEVEPEKLSRFFSSRSRQGADPETGDIMIDLNWWAALSCLLREQMIRTMTLPANGPDGLEAYEISTEKPRQALAEARSQIRRLSIVRAIVDIAMAHYETGKAVEEDLGNSPDESEGPSPNPTTTQTPDPPTSDS